CEENSNSFIENNTISKNEYNGINIIDSEGIIQNNTITENENKGINCYNSSPDILKNDINKNIFTGIYCKISSPIISKNLIIKNGGNSIFSNDGVALKSFNEYNEVEVAQHGGISIKDTSNANIQNNIISQNWGINSGGIFCDSTSSASIINNHLIENASIDGGSMNVESSSVKIINNIIANSKKIVSNQRLSRWYKDNLFSEYIYEGINLKKVIYYFGFINNGPPGTVLVTGCVGLHKTVWAETGERFWVEAASGVTTWGEGGGLSVTVSLDTSSFQIINRRPDSSNPFITHGCDVIFSPTITSYGVGMSGVGIVVPNQENMPEIAYNNVYGNPGGNYIFSDSVETKSAQIFDLTGTDGNISSNPLLDSLTYELLEGSPCIDAGTPDTTGLSIGLTDYFGNPRFVVGFTDGLSVIDIGAVEYQFASTTTNEYILICQGEEYEGWFESGEYQRTLSSTTGTDSIVTTHLTVNPTYELEEDVSICEGEDYLGITEEGDHSREFETVNGCDSTVITHLKVNSVFNIVEDISICKGDNYEEFTTEGQHQREFISENGCDSIVITNLTVYPSFKPTFSVEVDTLISDIEYQTYQWYDAGGAIEGATNREFAITESGDFYLMASNENGCTYSSETFFVRYSISEEIKRNKFVYSILPNPNWGEFNFRIDSNPPEKLTVKLINGLGQVFEVREIEYPVINQIEHFNVSHLSKGIYHFVIQSDNYREDQKIVILK
ncbi:MAG: right-handed parallel beta-helix repeat-containing protein, partial [Mariniphaga sp.]|nr:right-handed parallel beta-helix repeat-containing protein [Mariniphaga sp.]